MKEEHKETNKPLIREVAKDYEEDRETMVQSILKEISFRTNEDMPKESREMLSKLNYINNFHLKGYIQNTHPLL